MIDLGAASITLLKALDSDRSCWLFLCAQSQRDTTAVQYNTITTV